MWRMRLALECSHERQPWRCPAKQAAAAVLGEACLPVDLAPGQVAACRAVLARAFEVLADPHPPRHSGHRAAQLRAVAAELRRVGSPSVIA